MSQPDRQADEPERVIRDERATAARAAARARADLLRRALEGRTHSDSAKLIRDDRDG